MKIITSHPKVWVLLISLLALLFILMPTNAFAEDNPVTGFEGKTLSILGDSISTYAGVSNDGNVNSTLKGGAIYYSPGTLGVYQKDTWWQQAVDELGMELLVNNSWSGSCLYNEWFNAPGAYIDRCVQLHNNAGEEPDIIAVYLGTNDFWAFQSDIGSAADIDYDTLIVAGEDGFSYAEPKTACEAFAIILHKMTLRYPQAEIYCFTLPHPHSRNEAAMPLFIGFNASLIEIAEKYGAYIVDLYRDTGIKGDDNYQFYMADNGVHPGPAGMDAITGCFTSALLKNSRYTDGTVYDISYQLDNLIIDQGTRKAVLGGTSFSCSVTPPTNYSINITVTMDGQDITDSCYADKTISIDNVTGDIQITGSSAFSLDALEDFRWEITGDQMVNISKAENVENALTVNQGSIIEGNFNNVAFTLDEPVYLYHDVLWSLEFKSQLIPTSTTAGTLLFASSLSGYTADQPYLFRSHTGGILVFGIYHSEQHYQYGLTLRDKGIDPMTDHTYLLTNRIFEDGSNMVYLYVDNREIGPLNHYFINGVSQGTSENWLSGQDFKFTNMGTTSHPIHSCYMDYIQVWEKGHTHSYTLRVTEAPTCVDEGYGIYECSCGGSYAANVDPTGQHIYEDGVCSVCGKSAPVLTLSAPSLEFKDMIKIVAFFSIDNTEDVVEMGMITYESEVSEWNIDNAKYVLPGAIYVESDGRYFVTSQGIHAKQLADEVYLAVYAKLHDGSYLYSKLVSYSATAYAHHQLSNSTDVKLKQLVAAMLNYGAEAQRYFGYHTDCLANSQLTEEQMALPEDYCSDMIQTVPAVDAAKAGAFLNNGGFAQRRPAVSFEGAFSINYFFTPSSTPTGEVTMYYWNEADFAAADVVTAENATGSLVMTHEGSGLYRGDIHGIAAKDLSGIIYVAAVYSDGTATQTSGVLGYSIGVYCGSLASKGGLAADLAMATAVYGHHAKEYFS